MVQGCLGQLLGQQGVCPSCLGTIPQSPPPCPPHLPQVMGQKIRGGSLAPRSELQLEVAEACLRDVHVQARLRGGWGLLGMVPCIAMWHSSR